MFYFHCVSGEVKTLLRQLLSGVNHLHDNWIIHRDLKFVSQIWKKDV